MQGQRELGCHRGGTCSRVQSALFLMYLLLSHGTEQTWPTISQVCHVAVVPSAPQVPQEKELNTGGHRLAMATTPQGSQHPMQPPRRCSACTFWERQKQPAPGLTSIALSQKGKTQLGLSSLPTSSHPPPCLSVRGFLLPAAKFIAFAHANSSQSLLPVLSHIQGITWMSMAGSKLFLLVCFPTRHLTAPSPLSITS